MKKLKYCSKSSSCYYPVVSSKITRAKSQSTSIYQNFERISNPHLSLLAPNTQLTVDIRLRVLILIHSQPYTESLWDLPIYSGKPPPKIPWHCERDYLSILLSSDSCGGNRVHFIWTHFIRHFHTFLARNGFLKPRPASFASLGTTSSGHDGPLRLDSSAASATTPSPASHQSPQHFSFHDLSTAVLHVTVLTRVDLPDRHQTVSVHNNMFVPYTRTMRFDTRYIPCMSYQNNLSITSPYVPNHTS